MKNARMKLNLSIKQKIIFWQVILIVYNLKLSKMIKIKKQWLLKSFSHHLYLQNKRKSKSIIIKEKLNKKVLIKNKSEIRKNRDIFLLLLVV